MCGRASTRNAEQKCVHVDGTGIVSRNSHVMTRGGARGAPTISFEFELRKEDYY